MLQQAFLNMFDMSITAGYCVIFVMIIRFFMRRLPRSYSYILWAVVFLRLLVPSLPESDWSLIPRIPFMGQEDNISSSNSQVLGKTSALSMADRIFDETTYQTELQASQLAQKPVIKTAGNEKASIKIEPLQVSSLIWVIMAIAFMLYGIASNCFFKYSLKDAEWVAPDTYEVDGLQTAFIMGVIKTRIYLPANLSEEYRRYVIAHEETHRKRADNLIKYVTFTLTCIHWFNPLVWIAFYFMCCDMEMSCDEKVLRTLGIEEKKAYSMALLSVASGRKLSLGMPLAFSETSTKSRIMNVLKYRRPKFWATCAASAVIVAVMMGLLCNPSGQEDTTWDKTFLNYVIPEEIDGKKVITLGLPCSLESVYEPMHEVVMKYNEQSTEYYVEIISFTDDWQKYEAAQGEIVKMLQRGEGTDILSLRLSKKEELAMSGVLVDLKEFENDELGISSFSDNKEAARDFIEFYLAKRMNAYLEEFR